jgi:hypothetical protein
VIRLDLPNGLDDALAECARRGLVVQSERELAGRAGSRHLHLRFPDRPGTIELSDDGHAWVQVHPRRDGGWAGELAQALAARGS